MKKMPINLDEERNERYRFFKQFSRESVLVTLVCIAIMAATISWFRAERAIDAANASTALATTWQTMYKETERECRLAQLEIDDFKIILVRAGFDTHDGERP